MEPDRKEVAFLPPEVAPAVSARTWALAALAMLLLLGVAAIATLRHSPANTGEVRGVDPYAGNMPITGVQLSEATNGTGGKTTYVDGTIANTGDRVLTGALLQVTFRTAEGTAAHREILPLALVRTRVPYVDLQPVSSEPVLPSQHREFRLIFDSVPETWDVKPPAIQVVHADVR